MRKRRLLALVAIALPVVAALLWKPLELEFRSARGHGALAARQNERAVQELETALKLAPDRTETLFLLARAHRRLGNLDRAGDLLQQFRGLGGDPERAQREAWLLLARAGRLQDAESRLAALLADPRDDGPDIYDSFVQGYLANVLVTPAEQLLDAWQKEYPGDAQQYFMRADLSQRMGRPRESVEAYRRGLSLAPGEAAMRHQLALVLMASSEFDEAAEELHRCMEHDPENSEVLAALAECLRKRGEVDRAADMLRQLLARVPDFYKAHRILGEIELNQGRPAEALAHLQRAAGQRPYDIAVRFMLGQTLRALGRSDEAKGHLDYVARADEALNRVERQCRLAAQRPDDVELRYEIGTSLLAYGNPQEALKWLSTVLQAKPDHAAAHRALADYFDAHGDPQRARYHRRQLGAQGPPPQEKPVATANAQSSIQLRNVTARSGVAFRHTDGSSGRYYIVESVASGLATFDYDGDGLIDIYFLNGRPLKGMEAQGPPPRNHLYRNLGGFRFEDATQRTGVGEAGYGLGVCVGDYDNDGDPDLYVSNFGPNVLYRNHGDGTFTDVTRQTGTARGHTAGAGANFLDVDADGSLDLFVSNYVRFDYESHAPRFYMGTPRYPAPRFHPYQPNVLYHNRGGGAFADVTRESGIGAHRGPGMGTVCLDYDNDGDTDVFVCNDTTADFLFRNDGRGRFEEVGMTAGVALNAAGLPLSSMGADCGDYDRDGWLDLFVTDYQAEPPALYRNLGDGAFDDVATRVRAHEGSFCHVKWGCGFVDFDNDGDKDIFFACGHTEDTIERTDHRTSYEACPVLLRNTGDGKFVNVSGESGDGLTVKIVGRGVCFDDLDNDGRVDVVILSSRRPALVLRNESETGNHWLQLRLQGTKSNRDGVGARVKVVAGELVQIDEIHSGRGYQSHFGSRLHFGLGRRNKVDRVEVRWLGGSSQVFENVPVDRLTTLVEGSREATRASGLE